MLPTLLAGLEASQAQIDTFIQFYKAHSVGLYRYALSWVKNPHQAEDIAQTAWLQCVQHAQRFFSLPEEKRLPWMVTLVKHAALTHLRTAGRTVPLDPEADLPAPEVGDPGDIIAVLRSMPETYRTVLELRFLEALDSAEIARRTGLSVSAVDTRIHRGRKRLQEALRKEGYGRG